MNATDEIIIGLEARWPRWQVWVVRRVVGPPTWCARTWDDYSRVLNASSADELERYLKEADSQLAPAADLGAYRAAGQLARRYPFPWTIAFDGGVFTATRPGLAEPLRMATAAALETLLLAREQAASPDQPA